MSGSTKLNMTMKETESEGTFVLRCTCPLAELASLQHVNLGACEIDDIPYAFTKGMSELCELHGRTGVGDSGEYLPSTIDRQVGLECSGLQTFSLGAK